MKRNLITFTAAILLLGACRQQENANQLNEISDGLVKATELINVKNMLVYMALREKSKDPRTLDNALIWLPRAEVVSRQATQAKIYIDSLKEEIVKRTDSLRNKDARIVQDMMEINRRGDKLYNKLALFKDSMSVVFSPDDFINNQLIISVLKNDSIGFFKAVPLLSKEYVSVKSEQRQNSKEWIKNKFSNSSPLLAITMLNKIESDVVLTENFLIEYCNSKVVDNFCGYYKFRVISSISSSCVRPGDTVAITAGVGNFDDVMRPRITIDGITQYLNSKKVAVHTFIAARKPGKHTIPVKFEFIDANGIRETATKEMTYYITDAK